MDTDPSADRLEDGAGRLESHSTPAHVEDLFDGLTDFAADTESSDAHEEIRELEGLLSAAHERGLIDSRIRGLRVSDAIEAFVGSVIFTSPLLVEDGVFDIADYLFGVTVHSIPFFLIANTLFVVTMTYALVEWTGRDKTEAELLFGRVPTRVIMILVVSFLTAAVLMTVWGRVGNWQPPTEALARINVLWTVGSLGAALGDILSVQESASSAVADRDGFRAGRDGARDGQQSASTATQTPTAASSHRLTDVELVDAILERFHGLESHADDHEERHEMRRLRERTRHATLDDTFGDRIRKYTTRDIAEAFVGSIFFAVPFLVEDGVFDIAEYFLSFRVGGFPVFFLANAAFVLLMVMALVYWAGPQDVQVHRPIFGLVPRRMVGISIVSFLTAAALMTMWGRVADWHDPVVAIARISVVWTVASFGAALGDILPGESSGDDINDDLAEFGGRLEDIVE
ncbi:hypothetical protein [Natrinema versiforme]|uniref:DUF2391 family protein n=1 Tax=Natrinema versiforme TaxID=88724 RepID=A0A4V1FXG6_9EURY|nr:hypothetical protein [Natrinema versiforme]QCS40967.1 hypothetical protein FEJ81_00875 [Natrinema versiforme]